MAQAARLAVQREVAADVQRIGAALIDAVRDRIPAYRQLHPSQTAEITAIATWALSRIIEIWVHDGALTDRDLLRFRGIGAARARDGRPLAAVLRAYRVAAGQAIEAIVHRGRGRLDIDDVLALARLWLDSIDELSEAVFAGYSAAAEQLSADRDRALRELFDDLLVGRHASAGALGDRFRRLAVTPPARPHLLLAGTGDPARPLGDGAARELAGRLGPADLTTSRGGRVVMLLSGLDRPAAVELFATRGWHGCLIARHGLTELPVAYRLASDALDTAPGYAFAERPLLSDGDAHVLALLAARGSTSPPQVTAAVLGPLADPANRHLLDSLGAYLAAGSATTAADHLHVHPQTMRYRLRQVRELTGHDPRQPWQRLVLDIARNALTLQARHRALGAGASTEEQARGQPDIGRSIDARAT